MELHGPDQGQDRTFTMSAAEVGTVVGAALSAAGIDRLVSAVADLQRGQEALAGAVAALDQDGRERYGLLVAALGHAHAVQCHDEGPGSPVERYPVAVDREGRVRVGDGDSAGAGVESGCDDRSDGEESPGSAAGGGPVDTAIGRAFGRVGRHGHGDDSEGSAAN